MTVEIKEAGRSVNLASPRITLWLHPANPHLEHCPSLSYTNSACSLTGTQQTMLPAVRGWGSPAFSLTLSRPTLRGSDPRPLVSADTKEASWQRHESPGEGGLEKGKEKEQDFASSNSHNGKTNSDKWQQHSTLCKAITCFAESVTQQRGTTGAGFN